MKIETAKYSRRPFDVEAVRVTWENMEQVAEWCSGEIVVPEKPQGKGRDLTYIQVPVYSPADERQSRAFPGDFVLLQNGSNSFKVYTAKAFNKNFVKTENLEQEVRRSSDIRPKKPSKKPNSPKPANGIKPEAREALRKMGESVKKAGGTVLSDEFVAKTFDSEPSMKDETPSAPVEVAEQKDSPELQVVDRPQENTTAPKLEPTENVEQPKPGRKFIQKSD